MSHPFKLRDKVIINPKFDPNRRFHGVVFEIERFKKVNYLLSPVHTGTVLHPAQTRKVNCRPEYLLPAATGGTVTTATGTTDTIGETPQAIVTGIPYEPPLTSGTVALVRPNPRPARWTHDPRRLFVIVRQTTPSRVKVVPLGGGGHEWTVPRSAVTVVPTSDVQLYAKSEV